MIQVTIHYKLLATHTEISYHSIYKIDNNPWIIFRTVHTAFWDQDIKGFC